MHVNNWISGESVDATTKWTIHVNCSASVWFVWTFLIGFVSIKNQIRGHLIAASGWSRARTIRHMCTKTKHSQRLRYWHLLLITTQLRLHRITCSTFIRNFIWNESVKFHSKSDETWDSDKFKRTENRVFKYLIFSRPLNFHRNTHRVCAEK